MNKNIIIEFLGLPLKTLISENHYPSLNSADLTTRNCTEIRSHLYGVSNHDEKLKNQMVRLLLKGHIEEFDEKNQSTIIGVKIQHKSEQYLAQLKINEFKWSFLSLQYLGQAPKKPLVWVLSTVSILSLSFALFLLLQHGVLSREGTTDHSENFSPPVEEKQAVVAKESLSIEELKRMAEEQQYVLLTEKEHDQLLLHAEPTSPNEEIDAKQSKIVTIVIRPGINSYDIAMMFEENGLARSAEELDQLFHQFQIQKKIRSGTFTFPSDATYMDIIHGLTRNNF